MFGKLLKYEFKTTWKIYTILYIVLAGLSFLSGFTVTGIYQSAVNSSYSSSYSSNYNYTYPLLFSLLFFIMGLIIASIYVTNLVITIRRFYQNIFGREGYLTWTLPVGHHQILLSKFTAALIWYTLSSLAVMASLLLIFLIGVASVPESGPIISGLFTFLFNPLVIHFLFSSLLAAAALIMMLYFSMALGQLVQGHRILMSFVAFIVLWLISGIVNIFLPTNGINPFYSYAAYIGRNFGDSYSDYNDSLFMNPHFYLVISSVVSLIKFSLFYLGTYLITRKKLNLE